MSSTPSEREPASGSGLVDRWLEHRTPEHEVAPASSPRAGAAPLVEPSGTIPGLPRSRQAVEADIQAALGRRAQGTASYSPEDESLRSGGRHIDHGPDEMGGLDHEQRRERLARMLHNKIRVDPLTAPLSVVEGYADPAEEAPAVPESTRTTTDPDPDPSAATTPPKEPMKSDPSTGPEPSPIAQLSAMFEPRWDTDEDELAEPVEGPGLDVGRRPTCSTDGPADDTATEGPGDNTGGDTATDGPGYATAHDAANDVPPGPTTTPPPQRVEFAGRHATQRVLLALLLVAFVGLCLTGWTAWQERTTATIAVAVFFAVVTLVLWSMHSRAAPPKVVVENGVLTITRHEARHIFDLKSSYTPIEAVGTPGRRGWKVLITRRSMDPFVIDDSMVEPHEFMKVLEHYRPTDSP